MRMLYKTVLAAVLPLWIFAADLSYVSWIGDGRPERTGADWYEEDPAQFGISRRGGRCDTAREP
jgi:hypothetical protein